MLDGSADPSRKHMDVDLGISGCEEPIEIGRGGFAIVYRMRQPAFGRSVAIKILVGDMDPTALSRFERECSAVGSLSGHPNIVQVYEVGQTDDERPYIVMELLHRGSIADRLKSGPPLRAEEVADVGVKLAGALDCAHSEGVLHRDVKPENVLVSRFGEPKLADFGIARIHGRTETKSGLITASLAHAPPEVLNGDKPSIASDIYSLGSTLYMLLAGRSPFEDADDETMLPMLVRIASSAPPRPGTTIVPDPLWDVLERSLSKDPVERHQSAAELGRELQAVQRKLGRRVTQLPLEATGTAEGSEFDDHVTESDHVQPDVDGATTRVVDGQVKTLDAPPRRSRRHIPVMIGVAVLGMIGAIASVLVNGQVDPDERETDESLEDEPGPSEVTVFQDDFADPSSGFTRLDVARATIEYLDGGLSVEVRDPDDTWVIDTALEGDAYREELVHLADIAIEATAVQRGDMPAGYGLVCRSARDQANHVPRYGGLVDSDGFWGIYRYDSVDEVTTVAEGSAPSRAVEAGTPQRLRLECLGGDDGMPVTLRILVDGELRGEGVDASDDALRRGVAGMTVASREGGEALIHFDDFRVVEPR